MLGGALSLPLCYAVYSRGASGASGGSGRGSTYCCGFASGLGAAFLRRRLPPACPLRGALGLAATCSGAAASVCSACSARVFGSCGDFVFWGSLFCFCVPVLRCAVLLLLAWGLAILPRPVPGAVLPCVRCPPLALGFGCCAGSIAVCVTFSSSIAFSTNICDLSLLYLYFVTLFRGTKGRCCPSGRQQGQRTCCQCAAPRSGYAPHWWCPVLRRGQGSAHAAPLRHPAQTDSS